MTDAMSTSHVAQFIVAWLCCEQGHAAAGRPKAPATRRLTFSIIVLMSGPALDRDSSGLHDSERYHVATPSPTTASGLTSTETEVHPPRRPSL
jgi:hypothetical protein